MIRLRNLRFKYNSHPILDGVDFAVDPGDRIGLVGPNGSGKTTLCRIIMGLLKPEAGEVEIFGKKRTEEADFAEIRGRIGYLFQDSDDQLFCPTVLEDVAFGPLNLGKSTEQARRIVSETLDLLELRGYEQRITYQLSGGEKRLVSLASVLAMEPEVLILDEPTSGLDEETSERIANLLTASRFTYILIAHDMELLTKTTNKTFKLKRGALSQIV
ncbi:MAG TPA: ABC transporter ATP-binding protein [Desulfomonilaceae bacterium]|nr:ABC transporter ATP-binding protein [Desulfomonilaceae bacterium]